MSQAQALVDEGYMEARVDLEKIGWYWRNMLLDYPGHPASLDPQHSVPITLYGTSAESKKKLANHLNEVTLRNMYSIGTILIQMYIYIYKFVIYIYVDIYKCI